MPDRQYNQEYFSKLFNLDKYYTRENAGLLPAYRTHTDGTAIPFIQKGGAPVMEPVVTDEGKTYDPEMKELMAYAPLLFSDQELPGWLDGLRNKFKEEEGGGLYNRPAKSKLWAAMNFLQKGAVEGYSENVLGNLNRMGWKRPDLEAAAEVREPGYRRLPAGMTLADVGADTAYAAGTLMPSLSKVTGAVGRIPWGVGKTFQAFSKRLPGISMALGPATMIADTVGSAYRRSRDSANMENAVREVEPAQYTGAWQKRLGDWVRGTRGKDIHDTTPIRQGLGAVAQVASGAMRPITDVLYGGKQSLRQWRSGDRVGGAAGGFGNAVGGGAMLLAPQMLPYYAAAGAGQEATELIADSVGTTAQIHNNAKFRDNRLGHRLNMYDQSRGRNPRDTVASRAARGDYQARNLQNYYAKGWDNRPFNEAMQAHINQSSTRVRPFRDAFLELIDPKEHAKSVGKWLKRK